LKITSTTISFLAITLLFSGNAFAGTDDVQHGDSQKAILVTGASTGIGRNLAEALAADGHFVYAGARKQKDIDALSAIENIQGIRLDVTVQLPWILLAKKGEGFMAW